MKNTLLVFLVFVNMAYAPAPASGQSKLRITVQISPNANKNNPIAVDLVLVSDKKLLKELMKMPAKEWFQQKHQIQLDYPKATDLSSWEWIPGQAVKLDRVPVGRAIIGGVVFANYFSEGAHRAAINPGKDILLTLGEDDFSVRRK